MNKVVKQPVATKLPSINCVKKISNKCLKFNEKFKMNNIKIENIKVISSQKPKFIYRPNA